MTGWTPPLIYDDIECKHRVVTQEDVNRWQVIEAQYRDILKVVRRAHVITPFATQAEIDKLHSELVAKPS